VQVEHPVTELVTGIDIVKAQLLIAAGRAIALQPERHPDSRPRGRMPHQPPRTPKTFAPSPGPVRLWHAPGGPGIRVDSHVYTGYNVPPFYDSMIGKVISYGDTARHGHRAHAQRNWRRWSWKASRPIFLCTKRYSITPLFVRAAPTSTI